MTLTGFSVRPYDEGDRDAVLALVAADRLVGQPAPTAAALADAVAGRPPAATHSAELREVITEVVRDAEGAVRGVVSHGVRAGEADGHIAWLHADEDADAALELLEAALGRFAAGPVHAFALPTALSPWAPGLAVESRPAIGAALKQAGFAPDMSWRYLHRPLPPRAEVGDVRTYPIAQVTQREHPDGWELDLHEPDGTLVGNAVVGRPIDGVSALRWIAVEPERRGRGLGRALAEQCLRLLTLSGAEELVTLLDEQPPAAAPEYDTASADRLLRALGFVEVSPLRSYTRVLHSSDRELRRDGSSPR